MQNITESLNEEQIKPVMDTEGHVLVLAGAGSGKTRVLTSRIAYILDQKLARPGEILAITFTNKAAGEMRDRVEGLLGDTQDMWVCTIHSMCTRILRLYGSSIGVFSNFSIYSETEKANIIKKAITELGYKNDDLITACKSQISLAKCLGQAPEEFKEKNRHLPHIDKICSVYAMYDDRLRKNNALDFDDLLIMARRLLREDDVALDFLSHKFKYILVDEFQDTNAVQYSIIKMLQSSYGNLFVVGDDDQSIYGWRGAELKNILQFDRDFPDAKVYKLERNYRSTASILNLANTVIANNSSRHSKTLWTRREGGTRPQYYIAEEEAGEAVYVAKKITDAVRYGASFSDFAVLMRVNAITRSFEAEFTKYAIPFRVFGGIRFYERKEVKDMLAYLQLVANPFDDEAFSRIINVPRRGLGDKTLEVLNTYAARNGESLFYACTKANEMAISAGYKAKLNDFMQFIKELVITSQTECVDVIVKKIVEDLHMRDYYLDGTEEGESKAQNIDEFLSSVDEYVRLNPTASLEDYLSQVTLATDADDIQDGNYVTVATIHAVKGLEFDSVFIVGLEEGIMPTSRAAREGSVEEERRLMYVAATRAKSMLYLTMCRSRYIYGHREICTQSRFVDEAKPALGMISRQNSSGYGSRGYGYGGYGGYGSNGYGSNRYGSFWGGGRKKDYDDFGYSPDDDPDEDTYAPVKSQKPVQESSPAKNYLSQNTAKSTNKYEAGMSVVHKKFGLGIVTKVSDDGKFITVSFTQAGNKELSAEIAPLTIISKGL